MSINNDMPLPYEEERNPVGRMEPLLYDDLSGRLTPEGIKHLDDMGKLLSRADLEFFCEKLELAAQKYLRKKYM